MKDFTYVYILICDADESLHYTGVTKNLVARLDRY